MRPPDGAAHAPRLRRTRHDLLHRRDHVRRIPRTTLRPAATLEAHGQGRTLRTQVGPRLLRLRRPEEARADELDLKTSFKFKVSSSKFVRRAPSLNFEPLAFIIYSNFEL